MLGLGLTLVVAHFSLTGQAAPDNPVLDPPRNSQIAPLTTTVSITYDEPISAATVTSRTFAVHGMQSGLVTATRGVANAGGKIIVTPTRPFHQGELVYAIATTGTLNITGTEPISATQWQFNAGWVVSRCFEGFSQNTQASLTGVEWASVAWGDYDNDGLLDILLAGHTGDTPIAQVYHNQGEGVFAENAGANLAGVAYGSAAWGDYDNDGYLDILLTGYTGSTPVTRLYHSQGDDTFVENVAAGLTSVEQSAVAWGDYDNDGYLDILLTGYTGSTGVAQVYHNEGDGTFVENAGASLTGVSRGSAAWGDYDNDGWLDILLTGWSYVNLSNTTKVYHNRSDGTFVENAGASLTGVSHGSAAWGDYDNDGYLDILLTGNAGTIASPVPLAEVYHNEGDGTFVENARAGLTEVYHSSAAWGDYDNDGWLDILLAGDTDVEYVSQVYRNQGDGTFQVLAETDFTTVAEGTAVAWGDYDNDDRLDILLAGWAGGVAVTEVYHNDDCSADMALVKTAMPQVAAPGDAIAYTLAFSNSGTLTATQVVITDTLPPSVVTTLVVSSGAAITDTGASPPYVWQVQDLAPGESGVITITGVLTTGLPSGSVITNTATIAASADCDPTNNASEATVTAVFNDLSITKVASPRSGVGHNGTRPEPVVAGTSLFYTITIANEGLSTFDNIILSDTLHTSTTLQYLDQTDNVTGEFSAGTHWNTHWYDPRPGVYGDERLEILDTITPTGVFVSRLIDAHNVVEWTTLSWVPRRPYWKPLPNDGGAEVAYDLGNADMTANQLLLHLDEISGTTVFSDTSGQGNDATCPAIISETCPTAGVVGRFNGALSFDGTLSQTAVISDAADPLRYAIELWVYPTVVTDTSFILRTDTPTASATAENYSYFLGIENGRFRHAVNNGQYSVVGTTVISPNTWYHVVGTAESRGDIKLYVNGARKARLNRIGALWTDGEWYRLGSTYGPTGTSSYFSGRLDEVAIYSRTLSSGEVNDHYLRGALRLSFQVRSCDASLCAFTPFGNEVYSEQSNTSLGLPSVTLSGVPNNRYFQYRALLETDDPDYSPELESVTVGPIHREVLASQGSCAALGPSVYTCTLGTLAPGGVITVATEVDVNPSALGIITNTATIWPAPPDADPTNNTTFVTSTVVSEVGINIAKYDELYGGTDPVNPGSPMTYTLEVHNAGPSTAWDVTVTDTLPIAVISVSAPSSWDCGGSEGYDVVCTTDRLLPYTWPGILITGNAPLVTGTITNTGWITAAASHVYTTSNLSDTETTLVTPLADLAITKSGSPDPVDPGETVTYTIVVTNSGPSPATDVMVEDTLWTDGLVSYPIANADAPRPSDWICDAPGAVVVCTLLTGLDPETSASFQLTVTAPLSGLIANVAVVEAEQVDPDHENDEAYEFVAVRPVADMHIGKADTPDPVYAAAPLTYTLTVTNTGYVPAGAFTATQDFVYDRAIPIRDVGRAQRYPANLHVGGVTGVIENLTVVLHDLSHDYPADLSILLVGPDGQNVILMSNVGGGVDAEDVTLTFNDAGVSMPINDALTSTVVYQPTNYGVSAEFRPPAPEGPYGGSLAAFNGASPNGLWRLYVMDTVPAIGGEIAGGWSLHFTSTTMDTVTLIDDLPAGLTGVSVAPPYDWYCWGGPDTQTCRMDVFGVNEPAVFTITATSPITGGVITNTATITSTTADLWPESNVDTITTTVIAVAELGIVKQVMPADVVEPSDPLTYTLTISNAGPSPVPAAVVTDVLPAGLTSVSAPGCDFSALPLVTCTLSLAPGVTEIVITANAPITSGVITNTAGITSTVSDPDALNNSASVTVTVMRQPIAGLAAINDSPTIVGRPTFFTATVTAGSDIVYEWDFGDGSTGTGDSVSHVYGTTGDYTAVVTASNSVNRMTATTQVSVVPQPVYLPLVMRNFAIAPDLVVDSIVASGGAVTVTIRNQGDAPVTSEFVNEFWVDVYIDPDTVPTRVNQTWELVGDQGLVWGVTQDALPFEPGEALTLTMSDAYYRPGRSQITGTIPITAPIWAQVDSAHAETDYGAVLENHEITGGAYNNISEPVYSSARRESGLPQKRSKLKPKK